MIKKIVAGLLIMCSSFTYGMDSLSDIETIKNMDLVSGTISRQEVRLIFTLKTKYWTDGTKISVVHFPLDSAEHRSFVRNVLDMRLSTYSRFMEAQKNSGYNTTVVGVTTASAMLDTIENKTGAIGYISKDYLVVNGVGHVDILKIVD